MVQIKKTHEQVTRQYEVAGAEPIKRRYGATTIVPTSAWVVFVDGEWDTLTIRGGRLRKDGTPSENQSDNIYYPGEYGTADELPEWAVPLTRFEEEDLPESLAQRMENDASSYDNDPEPWGED